MFIPNVYEKVILTLGVDVSLNRTVASEKVIVKRANILERTSRKVKNDEQGK